MAFSVSLSLFILPVSSSEKDADKSVVCKVTVAVLDGFILHVPVLFYQVFQATELVLAAHDDPLFPGVEDVVGAIVLLFSVGELYVFVGQLKESPTLAGL